MVKIALFGCKSTTGFILNALLQKCEVSCVITISPEDGDRNQVAGYQDLTVLCGEYDIRCYQAQRYDLKSQNDLSFFRKKDFDIGFVMGWQRLIPANILELFSLGVFGMHGSADDLPFGRGRSPMNWALIEQRKHFFTNIFRYDSGVDSGQILDTHVFSIQPSDTAQTMHYKNMLAMKKLIVSNIDKLCSGKFNLVKQKELEPTYYPKRTPEDSIIDWKLDVFQIEAFIRAVTYPFNGAYSWLGGEKIVIWRAAIFETDLVDYGYKEESWGTIVESFPEGKFLIKCRGGLLIVHDYECSIIVDKGEKLKSPNGLVKKFQVNACGYHDV